MTLSGWVADKLKFRGDTFEPVVAFQTCNDLLAAVPKILTALDQYTQNYCTLLTIDTHRLEKQRKHRKLQRRATEEDGDDQVYFAYLLGSKQVALLQGFPLEYTLPNLNLARDRHGQSQAIDEANKLVLSNSSNNDVSEFSMKRLKLHELLDEEGRRKALLPCLVIPNNDLDKIHSTLEARRIINEENKDRCHQDLRKLFNTSTSSLVFYFGKNKALDGLKLGTCEPQRLLDWQNHVAEALQLHHFVDDFYNDIREANLAVLPQAAFDQDYQEATSTEAARANNGSAGLKRSPPEEETSFKKKKSRVLQDQSNRKPKGKSSKKVTKPAKSKQNEEAAKTPPVSTFDIKSFPSFEDVKPALEKAGCSFTINENGSQLYCFPRANPNLSTSVFHSELEFRLHLLEMGVSSLFPRRANEDLTTIEVKNWVLYTHAAQVCGDGKPFPQLENYKYRETLKKLGIVWSHGCWKNRNSGMKIIKMDNNIELNEVVAKKGLSGLGVSESQTSVISKDEIIQLLCKCSQEFAKEKA